MMWPIAVALASGVLTFTSHRVAAFVVAGLMVAAGAAVAAATAPGLYVHLSLVEIAVLAATAVLAVAVPWAPVQPGFTDRRQQPLEPRRIRLARMTGALAIVGAALFGDVGAAGPAMAASLAMVMPRLGPRHSP